ncbi:MAG: DUF4382 domain-containing protein [bacterium]|nr:DUF4382 domain-containing protein [bacterium]
MNKNAIIGIVTLVVIIGAILFYRSGSYNNPENKNGGTSDNGAETSTKGTIFFSVTDAAANMGAISSIMMTVDKVEMRSEAKGWVTISESPKTFDLLELKSKSKTELLAKADVAADTYNQVRLHISKIVVTESGQAKEAKIPSNELKLNSEIKVTSGTESSAKFDVMASESLHKTGKGEFIFAPVVKFESRSDANVEVGSDNSVTISGGDADDSVTVGMDINGEVKENFRLDINANLELDGGIIKLDGKSKAKIDLEL